MKVKMILLWLLCCFAAAIAYTDINVNYDWRKIGAVSRIKNQEGCGNSDWAFAAIGALEAQLFRKNGKLTELSEQDLIDCSKIYGNNGCDGGDVGKAIEYVTRHGISTEKSYPFKGEESQTCPVKIRDGITIGTRVNCQKILQGNEDSMQHEILARGPITAEIHASPSFISYRGGIFTGDDCVQHAPNHNVLIVGYGVTNTSEKYWIVKNCWGNTWGEEGYARIARGNNTCGIANSTTSISIETITNKQAGL